MARGVSDAELERRKAVCRKCDRLRHRGVSLIWCARKQRRDDGKYCEPHAANEYRKLLMSPEGCRKWQATTMTEADFDTEAFPKLVDGKTVAAVGNAPTAAQFDHAAKIDACDVVIRFNRFTLDGHPEVGSKTDVIALPACYSPAYPDKELLERLRPLLLLVPPKLEKIEEHLWRARGCELSLLPPSYFGAISDEIGCRSTTGLAVICYLLDRCKPKSIYLTGFSFQRLKEDHYFDGKPYYYGIHDPVKDLHAYARRHDADLVEVDPHIERILHTGQPADELAAMKRRGGRPYSAPHRWVYEQIAQDVAGKTVLEIGAGIGDGVETLLSAGATVAAIEPHGPTCEHLRSRFPAVEVHQCDFVDYDGPACDVASCVEVAEHLAPAAVHRFLAHARRLCGRIYLSSPDRKKHNHGRRTTLEWKLALKAAGFTVLEIRRNKWATLLIAE